MNNSGLVADVSVPLQRRNTWIVRLLKSILRTQWGKNIAFHFGLRGFNRVVSRHLRYIRRYAGEKLAKGEILLTRADSEAIPQGESWVYRLLPLQVRYNSRVDVGAKLQAYLMSNSNLGSLTSPSFPIYIALSTSSLTPAKGDTTLSGETSVAGLGRASGTVQNYVNPSTVDGAASYDIYKQFTLTGSNTTVVSTALFDASSTGNMFAEVNFSSSAAMSTNDILQVTWTVNI